MGQPSAETGLIFEGTVVRSYGWVAGGFCEATGKIFRSLPMSVYPLSNGRGGDSDARASF
jgi:hypothetical protein